MNYLNGLVQHHNYIGRIYWLDYSSAKIITNDFWKEKVCGVPYNCFLVAATFDPQKAAPEGAEVLLLRVTGQCALPSDDKTISAKIEQIQYAHEADTADQDNFSQHMMQFGGIECRILGTFFLDKGMLRLGCDMESFRISAAYEVYRPRREALAQIVNYVDPIRLMQQRKENAKSGVTGAMAPFKMGTVRYTSTTRLHRGDPAELVPVTIQPGDFFARRTAVLGMTRTGKSNLIKELISVIKVSAEKTGFRVGQLIYDLNGEYSNNNVQDGGSLANVFKGETECYRLVPTPGFREIQNNFYTQIHEGYDILRDVIKETGNATSSDAQQFCNLSFDEPDRNDFSAHARWQIRIAAYQALLYKARYEAPASFVGQKFPVSSEIQNMVAEAGNEMGKAIGDPTKGLPLPLLHDWFLAARKANGGGANRLKAKSGGDWVDGDLKTIINMMAGFNDNETFIRGYRILDEGRKFHSSGRTTDVSEEIYQFLAAGKIVILDISVGNIMVRERLSKRIASDLFDKSQKVFLDGQKPPHIAIYIEEAHNLIGKGAELTDTWPRIAKEGAKYSLALIYSTQEVSAIHPNILDNSENFFVSHLNNAPELRTLSHFYDFGDFSESLLRSQDVGFTRIKTLSSPFVIPVQVDLFDPQVIEDLRRG